MKKIISALFVLLIIIVLPGCTSNTSGNSSGNYSSSCSCSSNIYNCDDFSSHTEAQSCFVKCGGTRTDIHQLDRDNDGSACEQN